MSHWIDIAAIAFTSVLLVPVAVLCVECLAATLSPRRRSPLASPLTPPSPDRPPLAVLIPAHNEQSGLPATLESVTAQLLPHDRLVVVADNCTDATASVAREFGATSVIERSDPVNRGKGFALDRGIRELESDPPAVVVMIDADCTLAPGALDALAAQVCATDRPARLRVGAGVHREERRAAAGPAATPPALPPDRDRHGISVGDDP